MRLSDSQTRNSTGFVGQLASKLGGMSVRLYDNGTSTTFASGTILLGRPGTGNTDTYIVTSKFALILHRNLTSPAPTQLPTFPTSPTDSLLTNFVANVKVIYSATPWGAPSPSPPSTATAVAEVIFKAGDSDWSYDVMLLRCNDAALNTYAQTSTAWNASGWTSTANLPTPAAIAALYQNSSAPADIRRKVVVAGFGATPIPTTIGGPPFPVNPTPGELAFSPPLPHAPLRNRPLPPNALQFRVALAQTNAIESKQIKLWPSPPAGQPDLSVTRTFKSARGCSQAAFLSATEDNSCVQADIGGGAFMVTTNQEHQQELTFVGVVSGSNGTLAGDADFQTALTQALKETPPQALETLREFLPWPPRNDVVTLLTDLVDEWPLNWPPTIAGFWRSSQQDLAATWVQTTLAANKGSCTSTQATSVVTDAFGTGPDRKATPSKLTIGGATQPVWHSSRGNRQDKTTVTIFYTQAALGTQIGSIQILAIGTHDSETSYKINWAFNVTDLGGGASVVPAFVAGQKYKLS